MLLTFTRIRGVAFHLDYPYTFLLLSESFTMQHLELCFWDENRILYLADLKQFLYSKYLTFYCT